MLGLPSRRLPAKPTAWQGMVLLAVAVLVAASAFYLHYKDRQLDTVDLLIDGRTTVRAMVADTPMRRSRGLAVLDELADGEGMYFVFSEPGQPVFWMKDMKFPIDILWIRDGELVDMTTDVPLPPSTGELPTYEPMVMVDSVLEVPAGFAQRSGLRLGVRVEPVLDTLSGVR